MQASYLTAVLQKAAQAPAFAGIYVHSVSLSAVSDWLRDPVLTIVWSMPDHSAAIESAALSLPGVSATILSRPSDTSMLLHRAFASPAELEDVVMGSAWSLGAWDLCRCEQAPLAADEDWRSARHGLASSFGHNAYVIAGQPLVTGDRAPDEDCEIAAREGYIDWRFVPLALATPTARQRCGAKDKTLQADCTRPGEPGGYRGKWMHPTTPRTANEHQYRLGRGNHGNRSKR